MIDYRENNHWSVYIHIVPKELSGNKWDKYYIGITSQTPKRRWNSGHGYIDNKYFYRAIKKYKWNNIIHKIIATHLTLDEACDMEVAMIKLLKSNINQYGYNLTSGGDTRLHRSYKGKNNPQSKPIYQFDQDLNFIAKYPSSIEADTATHSHSSEAAREKYSSGGFYWAREDNILIDTNGVIHIKNPPIITARKEIFQFDEHFNYINRYTSTRDAENKTNVCHTSIIGAAKGRNKSHGFYWLYKDDIDILEGMPQIKTQIKEIITKDQINKKYNKDSGCIKIVNITTNELFSSIANAAKHYNIDSSYLRKTAVASITNDKRTAKKCKWLLYDDYLKIYHLTNEEAGKSLFFVG